MNRSRFFLALLVSLLALAASACGGGGGGSVPDGAVAVVDGTEISEEELEELIDQAKQAYEAQKQDFPKVGTPEYQNVQTQYVAFLVQREEFEKEAEELGITVTEKDVDKEVEKFIDSRFDGKRTNFEKALADQGFTEESFRETIRTSVLSQKLFDAVTKDIEVEEADILQYYAQNQASYGTPESRDVRHILISEKSGDDSDTVDFAKSKAEADRIHALLRDGGDFAALAKQHSDDPGSKDTGGKLTISRGQTVPEFDKTAFELKQGAISEPVKTTYGYHIIEALSPVRKATTQPLDKVRASIRATLLQEKRTTFMTEWVEKLRDEYEGKVSYAAGYEPPDVPDETETTETGTE
jgi:peptidyl-prolyl cis-trans isomerase C